MSDIPVIDPTMTPAWDTLDLDVRARYVGLEVAQCAVAMLDRIAGSETDIHDVMPDAWEIGCKTRRILCSALL